MRRLCFFAGIMCAAAILVGYCSAVTARESREALLLEAGIVLKFPAFVSWPEDTAIERQGFRLCVLGEDDIEQPLRQVARHTRVSGRNPLVRRIYRLSQVSDCHLLFIAASMAEQLDLILDTARGKPVLTVSSMPGAAEAGVMINLFLDDGKVRFDINRNAVERSALKMSFRLLEAANTVL